MTENDEQQKEYIQNLFSTLSSLYTEIPEDLISKVNSIVSIEVELQRIIGMDSIIKRGDSDE